MQFIPVMGSGLNPGLHRKQVLRVGWKRMQEAPREVLRAFVAA